MTRFRHLLLIWALLVAPAVMVPAAASATPAPGWTINSFARPTNFSYSDSQDAVYHLSIQATGGTFTLAVGLFPTTTPLACNASAATVQTALEALTSIGTGNVSVSGGAPTCSEPNMTDYVITFGGALSGRPVALQAASSLSGASASATVKESQTGTSGDAYLLLITNVGAEPSTAGAVAKDILPTGVTATAISAHLISQGSGQTIGNCTLATVSCTLPAIPSLETLGVAIKVATTSAISSTATNRATVEGGGALVAATADTTSNTINATAPTPFGLSDWNFDPVDDAAISATQAGGHPFSLTATYDPNTARYGQGVQANYQSIGELKDVIVDLPPGFVGNPLASTKRCLIADATRATPTCPIGSQIGYVTIVKQGTEAAGSRSPSFYSPIYNLMPERGYPAEFGVELGSQVAILYPSVIRTASGYDLRVAVPGLPRVVQATAVSVTLFGNPAKENGGGPEIPFFTNPADCAAGRLGAKIEANSWQEPENWANAESSAYQEINGCNQLHFEPRLEARPTTNVADSPSGLDFQLQIPQEEGIESPATPPLKKAEVALPAGIAVNPSAANGLAACRPEGPEGINIGSGEIGPAGQDLGDPEATELGEGHAGGNGSPYDDGLWHTTPGHCPEASRIGTVEVTTPLLEETLPGRLYLGTPACAPCNSKDAEEGRLIHLYIEVNDPKTGVIVKLAGTTAANPQSGQLTASFDENPQLPFSDLKLHVTEGARAPLRTPATCGRYETTTALTPWSAPQSGPPASPSDAFQVAAAPNGSPCPTSAAAEPNKQRFEAGAESPAAGAYSPFVLHLTREDGSQELAGINLTLPPGLSGRLAGIPACPDADLAAAAAKSGRAEQAAPSCPAASEVGTVHVGAGSGPSPYYVTGHAYLAGPYKGAPLSLAIVTPAVAGPFDLGTVVVRAALYVNPETAQITVKSDPIPHILAGVPLDIRSVAVEVDRPGFTLNPTSCEAKAISGEAISTQGQVAPLTNRFQVGGCSALPYEPKLHTRLYGPTRRGSFPKLRAIVEAEGGEANSSRLAVTLPHSEFLEQGHFKTICTRVQFAAKACPEGSEYGWIRVYTPLLSYLLEGPAYLRSSSHNLPDLVLALHGPPSQPIELVLDGRIDSKHQGIRTSFEGLPDAPFSRAILTMRGGKRGLLVNSKDICAAKNRSFVKAIAQNGKRFESRPVLRDGKCGKAKRKRRQGHHHHPSHR